MADGIPILFSGSPVIHEVKGPSDDPKESFQENGSCQSCGSPVEPGVKLCSTCLQAQLDNLKVAGKKRSKLRQLIEIKIATRELEIKCIRLVGPVLVVIAGLIFCFARISILLGVPLIVCGMVWGRRRWNAKVKLESEIRALLNEQE